jgi:hypothetical protein
MGKAGKRTVPWFRRGDFAQRDLRAFVIIAA